jgi:hypothetical protein
MMLDVDKPFTIWPAPACPNFSAPCRRHRRFAGVSVWIVVPKLVAGLAISSLPNPKAAISPLNGG